MYKYGTKIKPTTRRKDQTPLAKGGPPAKGVTGSVMVVQNVCIPFTISYA